MKNFIIPLSIFGIVGIMVVSLLILRGSRVEYDVVNTAISTTQTATTSFVAEVVPLAAIDEARKQLDSAKRLLDDEESKILSEIDDREKRLEEIRTIRLSFSQAPSQPE